MIAQVYAQSLFDLAKSEAKEKELLAQSLDLSQLIDQEFLAFLKSSNLDKKVKVELINQTLASFDAYLCNLILIMLDNKRLNYLKETLNLFINQVYEDLGMVKVVMLVAREYDESSKKRLSQALSKRLGKEVVLEVKRDPKLLAGFKLIAKDELIDVSLLNELTKLQNTLLKGEDYGS